MKVQRIQRSVGIMAAVIACFGVVPVLQAAILQSDNFDDGVMGPQWTVLPLPPSGTPAIVNEADGVVHTITGASSSSYTIGYESASGYDVSGDFDASIDLGVVTTAGTFGNGGMEIVYPNGDYIKVMHILFGAEWRTYAQTKTGVTTTSAYTTVPRGMDERMKITRVGNTANIYFSQPTGTPNWVLIDSIAGVRTEDAPLRFYVRTTNDAVSISADWDNFAFVPEPATMVVLLSGLGFQLLRRKKN